MSERPGRAGEVGRRLLLIAHVIARTHHRYVRLVEKQAIYHRRMNRLRQRFKQALEKRSQLDCSKRTVNQCRHLLKDEGMCWTFLTNENIPLTNNAAEHIRPYVIWRKLSYASQSSQGDQFSPMILSMTESLNRMGMSTAKVLR